MTKALRETAAEVLRLAGFDVTTASNGAEALEFLAKNPVGVILLDLCMPVLDGVVATAIAGSQGDVRLGTRAHS